LATAQTPIQLHPDNPHYFLFRGKPAVLVTSGEHYGAVLNLDFDYGPYLDELQKHNFNLTRIFSGSYREVPGSFGIVGNILAPRSGKFICPWAEAGEPIEGSAKFDLNRWNERYFARLKDFVAEAGRRGIVVEIVLFCTMYDDAIWNASPMNARNNVGGVRAVGKYEVYSGQDAQLTAIQRALAAKIATELNGFDNVYFEICNEPYERGGLTKKWNDAIVAAIASAEEKLPNRHLIAQGFTHGVVAELNPKISILNFHAAPVELVAKNYHHRRAVAHDETGGADQSDRKYRRDGWEFLLSGGAVYDHLDFSFTPDHESGDAGLQAGTPGGGGAELRKQLAVLKKFIEGFDFVAMTPSEESIVEAKVQPNGTADPSARPVRLLAHTGREYAGYVGAGKQVTVKIRLPDGRYKLQWINPRSGASLNSETIQPTGGEATLASPEYQEDVAFSLRRVD
jgi:hypothetical protein